MIKQAKIIDIKSKQTQLNLKTLNLKSFEPDILLYNHLLFDVNGANFEMKTGKMGSEKSNHTNVLHIKRGTSTHHIFIYIFFMTCTDLYLAYKFRSIYSGGSWEKMSNIVHLRH